MAWDAATCELFFLLLLVMSLVAIVYPLFLLLTRYALLLCVCFFVEVWTKRSCFFLLSVIVIGGIV